MSRRLCVEDTASVTNPQNLAFIFIPFCGEQEANADWFAWSHDEDICSTPLGWAAKFGKIEMVELLLKHGAKPNLPNDLPDLAWATPLAWATRRGHGEIAELLKHHGAVDL